MRIAPRQLRGKKAIRFRFGDQQTSKWVKKALPEIKEGEDWEMAMEGRMRGLEAKMLTLLESCKASGKDVGRETYNACLKVAAGARNDNAAWSIYKDMVARSVLPDEHTFIWLMWASAKRGNVKDAEMAWHLMRKAGFARISLSQPHSVKVGSHIFSALVTAHALSNNTESALDRARSFLKIEKIPLNEHCVMALLRAYRGVEDSFRLLNWAKECHGVEPSKGCLNVVMSRCSSVAESEAVLAELNRLGLEPDVVTWHEALLVAIRAQEFEKMLETASAMRKKGLLRALSFKAVICGCSKAIELNSDKAVKQRYLESGKALYHSAVLEGMELQPSLNMALLQCFAAAGEYEAALAHRATMISLRIRLRPAAEAAVRNAHITANVPPPDLPPPDSPARNRDMSPETANMNTLY